MTRTGEAVNAATDSFEVKINANHAKRRLRVYIERHFGNGKDGRRLFLKTLRGRLLQHGRELEKYIGKAEFGTLVEALAEKKLPTQPTIVDRDTADRLRNLISQSVNTSFRPLQQKYATMIEVLFNMPEGYLSKVPEKKMPAYVMLQCMGQTALALMTHIKTHPIVDEVALLVGDAVLVRVDSGKGSLRATVSSAVISAKVPAAGVAESVAVLAISTPASKSA